MAEGVYELLRNRKTIRLGLRREEQAPSEGILWGLGVVVRVETDILSGEVTAEKSNCARTVAEIELDDGFPLSPNGRRNSNCIESDGRGVAKQFGSVDAQHESARIEWYACVAGC